MNVLGIDIGGSGIKAAVVDLHTGEFQGERYRVPTPDHPTPDVVAVQLAEAIEHFQWRGPVGCGFPGVIRQNVIHTAVNLDPAWVGIDLAKLIKRHTRCPAAILNDADAAGLAEMRLGAGKGQNGVVWLLTVGTGIGTALFHNGILVPNTEVGHLLMPGGEAEPLLSERTRKKKGLSWKRWAKRFDDYLHQLQALFWPDLFIVGGGGAKKPEKFFPFLTVNTPVVPAAFRNRAGIIGAALAAQSLCDGLAPTSVPGRRRRVRVPKNPGTGPSAT